MNALPEGEEKRRAVQGMFDTIAPRYDFVNRLMTFGLDRAWRARTVESLTLAPHSRVLDVACGTGDLCRDLAGASYAPVGVDLSAGMLHHADPGPGTPLVQGDGLALPMATGALDGAVSGFALRNVVDLGGLFAELARVIRPGGRIALLEVATPANPVLRAGHAVWFRRAVPLIGAAFSDADAYRYLPRSVAYLPDPQKLQALLRHSGFDALERRVFSGGVAQLLTGTRRP